MKRYPIVRPPLAPNATKRVASPVQQFQASPVVASAAQRAMSSAFPAVRSSVSTVKGRVPIPVPGKSYPVVQESAGGKTNTGCGCKGKGTTVPGPSPAVQSRDVMEPRSRLPLPAPIPDSSRTALGFDWDFLICPCGITAENHRLPAELAPCLNSAILLANRVEDSYLSIWNRCRDGGNVINEADAQRWLRYYVDWQDAAVRALSSMTTGGPGPCLETLGQLISPYPWVQWATWDATAIRASCDLVDTYFDHRPRGRITLVRFGQRPFSLSNDTYVYHFVCKRCTPVFDNYPSPLVPFPPARLPFEP